MAMATRDKGEKAMEANKTTRASPSGDAQVKAIRKTMVRSASRRTTGTETMRFQQILPYRHCWLDCN